MRAHSRLCPLFRSGTCFLTAPNGSGAEELDQSEGTDLFVTGLRYLTEVHLESRYSSPVLGVVKASGQVRTYLTFDPSELADAVGQRLGVPIRNSDEDCYCDVTGSRPYWRMRNADLSMSAYLMEVSQQRARRSLSYTRGSVLAGTTSRTLLLEGREEKGFRTLSGLPAANILMHHVVFESSDRVLVQLFSVVKSPSPLTDSESRNGGRQSVMDRTDGGWTRTSCGPVEFSMGYPVFIKGGRQRVDGQPAVEFLDRGKALQLWELK